MSAAAERNRRPRPYTGLGADSHAAKLLARLAHPTSYRDSDPDTVTPCEPMEQRKCATCPRLLVDEDEGDECWTCRCAGVKRANVERMAKITPSKQARR